MQHPASLHRTVRHMVLMATAAIGLAAVATACSQPAPQVTVQAPGATPGSSATPDGITISGTGHVEGAPDTLTITFGASLERPTVSAAVADNATDTTKMLAAIKAAGVDDKDMQTNNYNVSPTYDQVAGKSVPRGYQVTNSVVVKEHDLPKAGALIDSVTTAGGNDVRVNGVSFTLEDNQALLATARDKAYADAKAKAEQFAKLSGRPLGTVVSISEATNPQPLAAASASAEAAKGAATPINPGQVTTSLQVQVRYSFG